MSGSQSESSFKGTPLRVIIHRISRLAGEPRKRIRVDLTTSAERTSSCPMDPPSNFSGFPALGENRQRDAEVSPASSPALSQMLWQPNTPTVITGMHAPNWEGGSFEETSPTSQAPPQAADPHEEEAVYHMAKLHQCLMDCLAALRVMMQAKDSSRPARRVNMP
ncbi:hypothetical protein KFL_003500160 [Klebsormidium nitens]|uniref:Uncharacterized protein n=1 Tax=Klebsormidium nitens TaxID=105231 RepID=A0A1Y1I8U8_KLENI|nr:hypothetical protein KFL_003500160 [Klebsormidium nitens]|eukprot:GAQ87405.1 hypothetical protein KFL_003500160 [Klebsormidium nitens]